VLDGLEFLNGLAANPLGRAGFGCEIKLAFDRFKPLEQRVVGSVRDHRIGTNVVPVVVIPNSLPEKRRLVLCSLFRKRVDRLERGVRGPRVRIVFGLAYSHNIGYSPDQ
jgi:hypothetical protein